MQEFFKAISLSHHSASVNIRERMHLSNEATRSLLLQLKSVLDIEEALVVSTCNRTEVYYSSPQDFSLEIIKLLGIEKGLNDTTEYIPYFDLINDEEAAARHLFRVAMGLESQVIGDLQISNQIKTSYSIAAELEMAGPFLHRLLHTIFHANKRVQQETAYRDGAASISYACGELVKDLIHSHKEASVLVVGLGEMGRDVARNLVKDNIRLGLVNRTDLKAQVLAEELNAEFIPYDQLYDQIQEFRVIVSAVSGDSPIIRKEHFQNHARFDQKFLVDLCVPRSIDPEVEHISGFVVYDIDEIKSQTDKTVERRKEAIPAVEAIIDGEMVGFRVWRKELGISPVIQRFKEALEDIRKEEMARYLKKCTAEEAELMDKVTKGMVNKIIKLPVLLLKAACKRGEEESLAEVLNDLFNLEPKKVEK